MSRSWRARIGLRLGRAPRPCVLQRIHEDYLLHLLESLRPEVIHLLGLSANWSNQAATLMRVRERLGGKLPARLMYSSWGTDLDVFAAGAGERAAVGAFLGAVDSLVVECDRDLRLAKELGFRGQFEGKLPAFGGTDLKEVMGHRSLGRSSERRLLLVKGRDHANGGDRVGRAMMIMRALATCAEDVKKAGCRVAILQADATVAAEAQVLRTATGLEIEILPRLPYDGLLRVMGAARAVMAMTVNDGLPSALVEAMAYGALPVHSDLEPIREWIKDGDNGLLVPADDVAAMAVAIRRAVKDDVLVDRAADLNRTLVEGNLEAGLVRRKALKLYERLAHATVS